MENVKEEFERESLLNDINVAADNWVFEENGMRWSNNDDSAGDNFGSFIAGAKFVLNKLKPINQNDSI